MKIGLMGTHSCGKTTIAELLKEKIGEGELVGSVARDCPYPINKETSFQAQTWIFFERLKRECALINSKILICERTLLDDYAYTLWWWQQKNANMSKKEYKYTKGILDLMEEIVMKWMKTYMYLFKIEPIGKLEQHKKRDLDIEFQTKINNMLDDMADFLLTKKPVKIYPGTPEKRVYEILSEIGIQEKVKIM